MEHFDAPHAKLLCVIYNLCEKKQISFGERSRLKEFVDNEHPGVFAALEQYDRDKDADALYIALIGFIRSPLAGPKIDIPPKALASDETTSPQDTFLQGRKKVRESHPRLSMDNPTLVITEARETAETDEHRD